MSDFKKKWSGFFIGSPSLITAPTPVAHATGAIPKRRIVKEDVRTTVSAAGSDVSTVSTIASGMDSVDSDSDESSHEISLKKRVLRRTRRDVPNPDFDRWPHILKKLDSRKAPTLQKFDEIAGQHLAKYLEQFEIYCVENIRGNRDAWIGELETHLQDKTLKAFRSLRDVQDTYDEIKLKLCEWWKDMEEQRRERSKVAFKRAHIETAESMFLYSNRLERLYRRAYPKRNSALSRDLREKFRDSVPKSFRKQLASQIMTCKMREEPVTWAMMQKCARHFDLELEKGDQSEDDIPTKSMEVNVAQKRTKDAMVQHVPQNASPVHPQQYLQKSSFVPPSHPSPSAAEPWYARMNRPNRGTNGTCNYCGRVGHVGRDCRFRLRLCFGCGGNDHVVRNCSYRREVQQHRRPPRSASQPPQMRTRQPDHFDRRNNASNHNVENRLLNQRAPAQ